MPRYSLIALVMSLIAIAVVAKSAYIMIVQKNYWLEVAAKQKKDNVPILPTRGNILSSENEGLLYYGKEHGIYLGTTITAILLVGRKYFVCHVGDTRLYKISSSKIRRLTNDHTVIAKEIAEGRLNDVDARRDPRRNVLLQCIGATEDVEPDMFCGEVVKGDILLLCSDGFRHEISEKEILNTLLKCDNTGLNKGLRKLIDLNLKRKEHDNISAALIKIQ